MISQSQFVYKKKKNFFVYNSLILDRTIYILYIPIEFVRFSMCRCVSSLLSVFELFAALCDAGLFIQRPFLRTDVETTSVSAAILIGVAYCSHSFLIGPHWKFRQVCGKRAKFQVGSKEHCCVLAPNIEGARR